MSTPAYPRIKVSYIGTKRSAALLRQQTDRAVKMQPSFMAGKDHDSAFWSLPDLTVFHGADYTHELMATLKYKFIPMKTDSRFCKVDITLGMHNKHLQDQQRLSHVMTLLTNLDVVLQAKCNMQRSKNFHRFMGMRKNMKEHFLGQPLFAKPLSL